MATARPSQSVHCPQTCHPRRGGQRSVALLPAMMLPSLKPARLRRSRILPVERTKATKLQYSPKTRYRSASLRVATFPAKDTSLALCISQGPRSIDVLLQPEQSERHRRPMFVETKNTTVRGQLLGEHSQRRAPRVTSFLAEESGLTIPTSRGPKRPSSMMLP